MCLPIGFVDRFAQLIDQMDGIEFANAENIVEQGIGL